MHKNEGSHVRMWKAVVCNPGRELLPGTVLAVTFTAYIIVRNKFLICKLKKKNVFSIKSDYRI